MNGSASMRMPLLDRAFYLLDEARSPQDFTLILHLNDSPDIDNFYAGARSAMNRFPVSACCIAGRNWVWRENKYFKPEIVSSVSECETRLAIEQFVDAPFDLRRQPPVKQLLILNNASGACVVVTRFHHAAGDGLSAALWLGHQLNVAYGLASSQLDRAQFVDLPLRKLATSVRRSEFAFDGGSDPLWTTSLKRSGSRRWLTINFPSNELQQACRRAGGFTYNDLLATCALETLRHWNSNSSIAGAATEGRPYNGRKHDVNKIGLWIPMNVRREHNDGFGNGTSRIRIYARYDADGSVVDKCREVRRQVAWTSKHGEWVVPEISWFTHAPGPIIGPLLRAYLKLPSVDMATGVFSHAGSWIASAGEAFKHVTRIECMGLLHPRQSLAINAATHLGQTWLTLTYDPALLTSDDVQALSQTYERQIDSARMELS